jgi:hypothetical protein
MTLASPRSELKSPIPNEYKHWSTTYLLFLEIDFRFKWL